MPNKNYRHGYSFELRVKKYLESCGFFVVRSSGSHGVADLVAIKTDYEQKIYLIQCKAGKGYISKTEMFNLYKQSTDIDAYGILCTRNEKNRLVFEWVKSSNLATKRIEIK